MIRQRPAVDFDEDMESQALNSASNPLGTSRSGRILGHFVYRWRLGFLLFGLVLFIWIIAITFRSNISPLSSSPIVESSLGAALVVNGPKSHHSNLGKTALVFLAHDRPEYLRACLTSVFAANGLDRVDLIVSMDHAPNFQSLKEVVEEFATLEHPITLWDNTMPEDGLSHTPVDHITTHHRQMLDRVFPQTKGVLGPIEYDYAIILETDLTVSRDFLDLFFQTGHLLNPANEASNSLFCISGWNDNGFDKYDMKEDRLMRTDFYPGLGWMIHKSIWQDRLSKEWPSSTSDMNYDWFMRGTSSVGNMDCITPEVPRTHHVAKYGTHVNGQGSYNFYASMTFASGNVPITAAEAALVGDLRAYEARVKRERFSGASILEDLPSPFTIPFGKNTIAIANDSHSWSSNALSKWAEALGSWGEYRGRHKGMLSFNFGPSHGHANVTIVTDNMREYWGV